MWAKVSGQQCPCKRLQMENLPFNLNINHPSHSAEEVNYCPLQNQFYPMFYSSGKLTSDKSCVGPVFIQRKRFT